MPIVLIDNYDSFTYNLYQLLQAETSEPVAVYRNDAIAFADLLAKRPTRIVLSPGPGHPAMDKDFGVCREILNRFDELTIPILGVCLGHQGIVHAMGGRVVEAPEICHGKTSQVVVTEATSPLLAGLPNPFTAMRYHSLVAEEASFPHDTLAITAREEKNGLIMALQHKSRPIYGVQFHPESIGTPDGKTLLRNFLERC